MDGLIHTPEAAFFVGVVSWRNPSVWVEKAYSVGRTIFTSLFQREVETLWMSQAARDEMQANLNAISRKIAKANFLLRTMRSRWDLFREKHRDLTPAVQAR